MSQEIPSTTRRGALTPVAKPPVSQDEQSLRSEETNQAVLANEICCSLWRLCLNPGAPAGSFCEGRRIVCQLWLDCIAEYSIGLQITAGLVVEDDVAVGVW